MLKEKITVGEAVTLIHDSLMTFEDGLPSADISAIIYAINNDIQIRDYLLGLPDTFPMDTCKAFLSYISDSVDGAERYSVDTIASAYFFETGDIEMAVMLLATALDTKSDYSLALLLKRVVEAGWPADSFRKMREELHPQVIANLEQKQDELI
jgi:hypothetical protein